MFNFIDALFISSLLHAFMIDVAGGGRGSLVRWCVRVENLYTGGPPIQVVLLYRWSSYTGGPPIQVVLLYRWSSYTGGPSLQMVFRQVHWTAVLLESATCL